MWGLIKPQSITPVQYPKFETAICDRTSVGYEASSDHKTGWAATQLHQKKNHL